MLRLHIWQIVGRKRVHVYPSSAPFVTLQDLEDIALFDVAVDMPYSPWYDAHAQVLDLAPGQKLSWPLNTPHRVENLDGPNLSMTVSFNDETIPRLGKVNLADGLLSHRFGYRLKNRAVTGPAYWSKVLLQKALRNTGRVKRERSGRRTVDFRLGAEATGQIVELKAGA